MWHSDPERSSLHDDSSNLDSESSSGHEDSGAHRNINFKPAEENENIFYTLQGYIEGT